MSKNKVLCTVSHFAKTACKLLAAPMYKTKQSFYGSEVICLCENKAVLMMPSHKQAQNRSWVGLEVLTHTLVRH